MMSFLSVNVKAKPKSALVVKQPKQMKQIEQSPTN